METNLLHMMPPLDDSIPCLDAILLDELLCDAMFDVQVLANDAIHDVVHDSNDHDEMNHETSLLADDPNTQMRCPQDTLDGVVQRCCIQYNVEVHDDDHSILARSLHCSHF